MSADFRIFDSSGPDGSKAWTRVECVMQLVEVPGGVRFFPTHCQFETVVYISQKWESLAKDENTTQLKPLP